jgi:hypothetical protein
MLSVFHARPRGSAFPKRIYLTLAQVRLVECGQLEGSVSHTADFSIAWAFRLCSGSNTWNGLFIDNFKFTQVARLASARVITSRTRLANEVGVKGFSRKNVSGSSTP